MLTSDIENYLSEISRVLKPSGRCLITFYKLNEEPENLMKMNRSVHNFKYKIDDNCFTASRTKSEGCIGFKEDYLFRLFAQNELQIVQPIQYGNWCERTNYLSSQDIIVAIKK